MKFFDKWNKGKFSIYKSEEKTVLKLIENINNFIGKLAKGIDNKTELHGDHKGSWQGLNRPTMSEEGLRATFEKLNDDYQVTKETNALNVKHYEIIGDGKTIESEKIQILLNSKKEEGKTIFYFPSGTYLLDKPLVIPTGITIIGDGTYKTTFKMSNTSNSTSVLNLPSGSYLNEIKDITINGGNIINIIGLHLSDTTNEINDEIIKIKDCYIINCTTGIKIGNINRENLIDNVTIDFCGDGIVLDGTDNKIINSTVRSCTGTGLIINGSNNHITNTKCFYCDKDGLVINGQFNTLLQCEVQENGENGIVVGGFSNDVNITSDTNGRINPSKNLVVAGYKNKINGLLTFNPSLNGNISYNISIDEDSVLNDIDVVIHGNKPLIERNNISVSNDIKINSKKLITNFFDEGAELEPVDYGTATLKIDGLYNCPRIVNFDRPLYNGSKYSKTVTLNGQTKYNAYLMSEVILGGTKLWIEFYNNDTFISTTPTEEINQWHSSDAFTHIKGDIPAGTTKVKVFIITYGIEGPDSESLLKKFGFTLY